MSLATRKSVSEHTWPPLADGSTLYPVTVIDCHSRGLTWAEHRSGDPPTSGLDGFPFRPGTQKCAGSVRVLPVVFGPRRHEG